MSKASLGSLVKERSELIKEKKKETPKTSVTTPPVAVPPAGTPPVGIARPQNSKRIEAVTPPIAVPQAPETTAPESPAPKKPNLTPPPLPGSELKENNSPEGSGKSEVEAPKEQPVSE